MSDHLLDHLAELECRLAGLDTVPDTWHGRAVTTDADFARFTEVDLDEATSRLTRLGACYRARLRDLDPATLDEATATFAVAGLHGVALDIVRHRFADSLTEYAGRLRLRGISTFEHLSEAEIARGFAALDADVAAETQAQPVVEDCDLLVLAKSAQDIARA